MKILFDCNVIIDIWGKTEDFFASYASFDVVLAKGFYPCIAASSMPSIFYVLSARKYLEKQAEKKAIGALLEAFDVLDVTSSDCKQAHLSEMSDYEDALISFAANRHEVNFIITRNKKDFLKSPVPALTPEEFVGIYKPEYLNYEMVDF